MATVQEKEARRIKAHPMEVHNPMWWCKEHRVFSGMLVEKAGRNLAKVMFLIAAEKDRPYSEFVPTAVWDSIELESWTRPANERKHWFLTPDKDKVLLSFEEGDTIWMCGEGDCGRWWPDKASAMQCYDSHG